jgi:hypothetical protein
MKKYLLKPGFEAIFSIALIAIFGLPHLMMAQTQSQDLQITIVNGDTTINGKKLKDLSAVERKDALNNINRYSGDVVINGGKKNVERNIIIKRKNGVQGPDGEIFFKGRGFPADSLLLADGNIRIFKDSAGKVLRLRSRSLHDVDSDVRTYLRRGVEPIDGAQVWSFNSPGGPGRVSPRRKNTQSFNYSTTNKDGFDTRISFRVTDESIDKGPELKDLNISPEFSSGKTNLVFNVDNRTAAEVTFKDSDGKIFWNDKTAHGRFTKNFSLPLNGIYYLNVKQGGKTTVKKIVKE